MTHEFIHFEDRLSDSPYVERVWRCHSDRSGPFLSMAACHFEMAITRLKDETFITLRGPETRGSTVVCPAEGEWTCIRFKLGTFMPHFLPGALSDQKDVTLPSAASRSFWLNGSVWEYPDFENADTFVNRLVKNRLIARDPALDGVLDGCAEHLSLRSIQRHFLHATGITHATWHKIERARHATNLLLDGWPIVEVVHRAGYFDQAHLTRSLKHLIGTTPAQIAAGAMQLSFLYKTDPAPLTYSHP